VTRRRGMGPVLERLHGAAIRVQVPIVLAAIPLAAALHGYAIAPHVVERALGEQDVAVVAAASDAVRRAVLAVVAVVAATTAAAALLLRGSIRAVVDELQVATIAIAHGDLRHRLRSRRRDELGRLGGSIDTLAERLERLEQARRRMLACVSHELRTPLTIIQGHAFTLARDEPDEARRARLELIQDESVRLAGLVAELIDASSLHAGGVRLDIGRRDLVEVAREQAARFDDAAASRGVSIRLAGTRHAVHADVDAARIGQALANLLANAVRHASPGSVVVVDVDAGRGSDAPRRMLVSNDGDPIESGVAARIFEPFVQGRAQVGSVGLGLAITHAIVEAHGGRITLDADRARTGRVCFELALPAPAPTSSSVPMKRAIAVRRAAARVAVVEP
jgi:signal transduction histidine kinase